MPLSETLDSLSSQKKPFIFYNLSATLTKKKKGSNVYYVAEFAVDKQALEFTPADQELLHYFSDLVDKENKYVMGQHDKALQSKGIIVDCDAVIEASNKYRNEQDYVTRFISEKVKPNNDESRPTCIKKRALGYQYKQWYSLQTGKTAGRLEELYAVFEKKYGPYPREGWKNLKIDDDENEDDDNKIVES